MMKLKTLREKSASSQNPTTTHTRPKITNIQHDLAERVRTGLQASGWTQSDLARETGYSRRHISRMLHGHYEGSLTCWQHLIDTAEGTDTP